MTTVIIAGARLADAFRRRRKLAASLSGAAGAVFVGFGAKLASASPQPTSSTRLPTKSCVFMA